MNFFPSKNEYVPIIGFNPLTRFFISNADLFCQSIFDISLSSIGARVKSSLCGILGAVPFSICFNVSTNKFAPIFESQDNGTIIKSDSKDGLYIKAKDGIIKVLEIQAENAKKMNIGDFLRGNTLEVGKKFE